MHRSCHLLLDEQSLRQASLECRALTYSSVDKTAAALEKSDLAYPHESDSRLNSKTVLGSLRAVRTEALRQHAADFSFSLNVGEDVTVEHHGAPKCGTRSPSRCWVCSAVGSGRVELDSQWRFIRNLLPSR